MSARLARLRQWLSEWVETWRISPPFSRRRRDLLAVMRDTNPDNWVEVNDPTRPGATS